MLVWDDCLYFVNEEDTPLRLWFSVVICVECGFCEIKMDVIDKKMITLKHQFIKPTLKMPHPTASILVIEDHAVVQLGINTLLSTCTSIGLIDRASTGHEALDKFLNNDFDIVMIDVELPDISGFDLLTRLREIHPTVKVLFYSMHEEYWVIKQMFNSEADGIVMKSDRLDELRTAVDTITAGGKYYSKEFEQFLKEYEQQKGLTPQEFNVLRLVGEGFTSQQIAERLFVSVNTIEFHRRRIMSRLGVSNMAELIKISLEKGYIKHSKYKMED